MDMEKDRGINKIKGSYSLYPNALRIYINDRMQLRSNKNRRSASNLAFSHLSKCLMSKIEIC